METRGSVTNVQTVWPLLAVDDVKATVSFWRDRLGFELVGQADEDGTIFWCRLQRGSASIMLQHSCAEDGPAEARGKGRPKEPFETNGVESLNGGAMTTRTPATHLDLNVTPLIDVLLVLLVIFMAAVPLAQQGLDTTVPADVRRRSDPAPVQIVVTCDLSGQIAINQEPILLADLSTRLRAIYESRTDKTLYVLGDAGLRYRAIIAIIDIAKGVGISRVGVITPGMRAEKMPAD